MQFKVLLGMQDGTADIFRQQLETNSSSLDVLNQNIAIFHNSQRALEAMMPDIYLISMNHIRYDSKNIENELLRGIAKIKVSPKTSHIRIAVQADLAPSDPFLRKLALLQVEDIFSGNDQNRAVFNIAEVANQLSTPPNLKNILKFLNLSKPVDDLSVSGSANQLGSSVPTALEDGERVKQLEKINKLLKQQNDDLTKKASIATVPREDYDDLIQKYENIMNSGLTDDKFKDLFKKIVQINEKQKADNERLMVLNKQLNNSIVSLNNQIEVLENSSNTKDLMRLKKENQRLKQQGQNKETLPPVALPRQKSPISQSRAAEAESNKSNFRKIIAILLVFIVLLGIGLGTFYHINKNSSNSAQTSSQNPSFSSLIKSGDYDTAAKDYPSRAVEAENRMLSDANLADKATIAKKINKYSTSDPINFDIDYFRGDYLSAVDLYNRSNDSNLTNLSDERRMMLAYALMKTGEISKAKEIAKSLKNSTLDQKINVYSKFLNANKILTNKIKNDDLTKSQLKEAKKQIEENQKAMDKL